MPQTCSARVTRGTQAVVAEERERTELSALLAALGHTVGAHSAFLESSGGERVEVPATVLKALFDMVCELDQGRAIFILPSDKMLTTQQAADMLSVSRPFLVKLLERGEMPFERAGSHRRVALEHVVAFRTARRKAQQRRVTELAREAQDLGEEF